MAPSAFGYHDGMVIATGTVRNGRIELLGDQLPEGSIVMVLASEGSETFELDPTDEAKLVSAMREADSGNVVSGPDLLAQLRRS